MATDFIAAPPQAPAPEVADDIPGDGWYPALKVSVFRESQRISPQVTPLRARDALIGGIASADAALYAWRSASTAVDLAATTTDQLAGENRNVVLWRRAVHAFAAADLVETHSDISATDAGIDRSEIRAASANDLRRSATVAIRDLLRRTRARVRLI